MTYDFKNKPYTTWQDETSGIGGKYRPTTYGIYDNHNQRILYNVPGWNDKWYVDTWEEAAIKADELNKVNSITKILT